MRTGWRHCSMPLNNDVGHVPVQNETRNQSIPLNKNCQSEQQNTSTRHENRQALPTKTPERCQRRCSGGFIANPKLTPHTAPVLHSSTSNRQMLEMLATCKGSEIYPKLIEKKLQHSTRGVATASR